MVAAFDIWLIVFHIPQIIIYEVTLEQLSELFAFLILLNLAILTCFTVSFFISDFFLFGLRIVILILAFTSTFLAKGRHAFFDFLLGDIKKDSCEIKQN